VGGRTKARTEPVMTGLTEGAHTVLEGEMDLHRDFAAEWGLSPADIEAVRKAPTCVAYTNFLVRAADEGSFPEVVAAVDPCGQGYLDTADHMADLATGEHRYTPFIGKYTGEELRESVAWMRDLLDHCGEQYPGERPPRTRVLGDVLHTGGLERVSGHPGHSRVATGTRRPATPRSRGPRASPG